MYGIVTKIFKIVKNILKIDYQFLVESYDLKLKNKRLKAQAKTCEDDLATINRQNESFIEEIEEKKKLKPAALKASIVSSGGRRSTSHSRALADTSSDSSCAR